VSDIADVPRVLMSPKGLLAGEAKMKRLRWFEGYISKPISFSEFASAVSAATLDIPELEAAEEDEPVDLLEEVVNSSARIVVAEDHMVNQQLFRTILEKLGHSVILAGNGVEAIEAANSGAVDLLFMDIQMPELNGYEATHELRAQGFNRPIIAVTANAVKGEKEKALESGMDDFLTKPFKKKDLVSILDKWLDPSRHEGSEQIVLDEDNRLVVGSAEFPVSEEVLGRPLALETGAAIDIEAARERFMGQQAIVDRVIGEFMRKVDSQLELIRQSSAAGDLASVRELAHAIKGGAWSLEAAPLGNAAALLEASAKMESQAHCIHYTEALVTAAEELRGALTRPDSGDGIS
jgi:CheY-like chemotaxis protein/HPt (histidine-containing phosphotransfer) domain-containing protein